MGDLETRSITVVATDIRNFTHHSLRRDHESETDFFVRFAKLCDVTRDFHDLTTECVRQYDPSGVANVMSSGDGLIVAFQDDQHALTAFKTVTALQGLYDGFFRKANIELGEKRYSTALGYGMGVHTGHVMERRWRSYNTPGKDNRLILGDAVNIATRLEKLTRDHPGCGVMVSEDTYHAIAAQAGPDAVKDCIDYQYHYIRGYKPLHLYGLSNPGWKR